MLSSWVFPITALLAIAAAQVDLGKVAAESPACSTQCTVTNLAIANCQLTDVQNCFCTNTTLLYATAICVQETCNLTEQAISSTILQDELCAGVPQPSRSGDIVRATIVVTVFTYVIFALRCISRYMVAKRIWWDDWALISAVVCTVPMTVIPIYNASKGFGKHFWDIPPANLRILRLLYYVSQILYSYVQPITKISILLLYLRIFPNKLFRIAVNISLAWMTCHLIAFILEVSLQCIPISSLWDLTVIGKCSNFTASIYAGAGLSIFEDLVIIALPVFVLKDLSLTPRKKIALGFVFALGSFACITSMVRLKYIVTFAQSVDVTWDNVDLIIWSIIEVYMAIICASLVSLRPLIAKLIPTLFPSTRATADTKSKTTSSVPVWPLKRGSRLSARLRNNHGAELHSEDEDMTVDKNSKIVTEASVDESVSDIELSERGLPIRKRPS